MINSFWKKFTLYNLGLLIIIIRIYGFFIEKYNSKDNINSIFPLIDENGYSFKEQIECDFDTLELITNKLTKGIYPEEFNISNLTSNKCFNFKKIDKCAENNLCENKFINLKMNNNSLLENILKDEESLFWETIFNENNFMNNKSMNFLYKILSGYKSYIHIMFYKQLNNLYFLEKRITHSNDKLNNLFYLESILLKSFMKLKNEKLFMFEYVNLDKEYLIDFTEKCINKYFYILNLSNEIKNETLKIIQKIQKIITIISNENLLIMKSCILDFKAIETMFKILFELKISLDEIKEFKFFLRNYIRNINLIFEVESKLNEKNKIKEKNLKIVSYIFYIISFIIILIMNWIFLKNKKNQNKKFFNTNKGINMRKYQIYKKNLDKIKENEQINQPRSYDSFSKEEQGYIDKLLNYQNNSY